MNTNGLALHGNVSTQNLQGKFSSVADASSFLGRLAPNLSSAQPSGNSNTLASASAIAAGGQLRVNSSNNLNVYISSESSRINSDDSFQLYNGKGELANSDSHSLGLPEEKKANDEIKNRAQEVAQKSEQIADKEIEQIRQLASRDREVRAHEQAHAAAGGAYAGSPKYQFEKGPDGVAYAVGGEVPIDIAPAGTPEQTITKAQTIRRAALAPANPSPQDRKVAQASVQLESSARQDLVAEKLKEDKKVEQQKLVAANERENIASKIEPAEEQKEGADANKTIGANHSSRAGIFAYETITGSSQSGGPKQLSSAVINTTA